MEKGIAFVTNISETLVGKEICGFTLKKVYRNSNADYLKEDLTSWEFGDMLFGYSMYTLANQPDGFLHMDEKEKYYYLYFQGKEREESTIDIFGEIIAFIESIVVFKDSGISFSHAYKFSDKYRPVIINSPFHNYYSINDGAELELEGNEFLELENFYEKYKQVKQNKDLVRRMVELWLTSRRTPYFDVKFILYVTILEMFIDGNAELTYRLSRSVAIFLGETRENSEEIYKNMKTLYNARSKYLHNGTENSDGQSEINAQRYARALIAKLITFSADFKSPIADIRSEIDKLGFGECRLLIESLKNSNQEE